MFVRSVKNAKINEITRKAYAKTCKDNQGKAPVPSLCLPATHCEEGREGRVVLCNQSPLEGNLSISGNTEIPPFPHTQDKCTEGTSCTGALCAQGHFVHRGTLCTGALCAQGCFCAKCLPYRDAFVQISALCTGVLFMLSCAHEMVRYLLCTVQSFFFSHILYLMVLRK
jgi:hypothetical protein